MRPWHLRWPDGVPKSIEYPQIPVSGILRSSAGKYPHRTATVFDGKETTYGEYDALSGGFAGSLARIISPGERVAIFLPNSPEFIISYFGVLMAGCVAVPCNTLYTERELTYQLEDSRATAIITTGELHARFRRICENFELITVDGSSGHNFKSLARKGNAQDVGVSAGDLAVLLYTGGTTGIPKGVMLTHRNIVSNVIQRAVWLGFSEDEGEIALRISPWCHSAGLIAALTGDIYRAAKIVIFHRRKELDMGEVLQHVERYGITSLAGTPQFFIKLLACPDLEKCDLSSVRMCQSGAAPLPHHVFLQMREKIADTVIEGYGLTEATASAIIRLPGVEMERSVGMPLPDTDAKVVDLETGTKEMPAGQPGEIILSGPQISSGYWQRPEETRETFRNGWLYTSDIGYMDDKGYFYIIDRKKDMLIYKGYNVYPRELEEILLSHPAVEQCAVAGIPDEGAGEIPKAWIVLRAGMAAQESEILNFCASRVAPYKKIRKVEFVKQLPVSHAMKVLKRELRTGSL